MWRIVLEMLKSVEWFGNIDIRQTERKIFCICLQNLRKKDWCPENRAFGDSWSIRIWRLTHSSEWCNKVNKLYKNWQKDIWIHYMFWTKNGYWWSHRKNRHNIRYCSLLRRDRRDTSTLHRRKRIRYFNRSLKNHQTALLIDRVELHLLFSIS